MSSTLSSPAVSAAITGSLSGGTAPAKSTAIVNDQSANQPAVGTSTNNASSVYSSTVSVASGTPQTIDLTTFNDPLAGAVTLAKLRAYKITNNGTTGQTITYGGGANEIVAAAAEPVQALGGFHCCDFADGGITVDGTHKYIILTCASGTASVVVTVLGHT